MKPICSTAGGGALSVVAIIGATGCSSHHVRANVTKLRETPAPRTVQVFASSSIAGRPMGDDSDLHARVEDAFRQQFPGIQQDESKPEMVVFFTIVDYVPGCLPNCKKFKTYRNWTCEVEIHSVQAESKSDAFVFNLDGSTYNPFHNPAANCASQLAATFRRLSSVPSS